MRRPRTTSLLLTVGLLTLGFAGARLWLETRERTGVLRVPDGMALDPWETLEARIASTWVSGDRLWFVVFAAGVAVLGAGAWRAARGGEPTVRPFRRAALLTAGIGAVCFLVSLAWFLTHEVAMDCNRYVDLSSFATNGQIGIVHALEGRGPPGMALVGMAGMFTLGLGSLLGLVTWLLPPRPPGTATPADRLGPEGPRRRSMAS